MNIETEVKMVKWVIIIMLIVMPAYLIIDYFLAPDKTVDINTTSGFSYKTDSYETLQLYIKHGVM